MISFSERAAHADLDEASISVAGVQSAITRTPATQRDTSFVAHGRVELTPRVSLTAGARGDWWTMTNPGGLGTVQDRFFFAPRLGATIAAGEGQTIRATDPPGLLDELTKYPDPPPMVPDFHDAVRRRVQPASNAWVGSRSVSLMHLANTSIRLGRPVTFDGENWTFPKDDEANRLQYPSMRAPWHL